MLVFSNELLYDLQISVRLTECRHRYEKHVYPGMQAFKQTSYNSITTLL